MFEFLDFASQIVGLIAGIIGFCPTRLRKAALRRLAAFLPPLNRFLARALLTSILFFMPVPDLGSTMLNLGVGVEVVVLA